MKNILTILLTGLSLICNAQVAPKNETFDKFTERLKSISKQRDYSKLKSVLHDTIFESNDICGYPGCSKSEFLKHHFTNDSLNSDWKLLSEIIELGFTQIPKDSAIVQFSSVKEVYEAPSYMRKINWSESLMILDKNVSIKEKPSNNSKTIKVVDKEVFSCNCCIYNQTDKDLIKDELNHLWIRVKLNDQNHGYIQHDKTSQRFYKVLEVALIKGQWRIISWYTGEPC